MDSHGLSTEPISFSRLATQNIRQIYAHKLQGFRWLLGLAVVFQLTPNTGKLYWHYSTHHSPSILPDFLAFSLSLAARITWLFLFRNPAEFLLFRRPGRGYQWAVCGTVILTTLPNGVVHIWALKMALKNDTVVLSGIWTAILAIIFLVPLAGLVSWMAWRFLLGFEETDEKFEPTVKYGPSIAEYRDNPTPILTRTDISSGYLSQAYEAQKISEQEEPALQSLARREVVPTSADAQVDTVQEFFVEADPIVPVDAAKPPRCQTIARFEHMSESHSGPHSWFSFPIIPVVLSVYAALLLVALIIWIHEDREYKLRDPSQLLKRTLCMPIGMCLLAFYAYKHHIRASIFERFDVEPPQPWKKMLSILPSWFGTGGTYKNRDTGEITVFDPGRRAFPWRATHRSKVIDSREYITAFNANPGLCTTYWGHSGRSVKTDFKFRATIHRLGFLVLAIYLTLKGFWSIIWYNVPNVYDEVLKHPTTITKEDIARISRILSIHLASLGIFGSLGSIVCFIVRIGMCGEYVGTFCQDGLEVCSAGGER
ncbi:hypothetical protein ONS96_008719 [Cadophora gregata f. sp. sojae]|nr:hypothetical protein ONS96_008719 [Cadophora gregata f. sp. sojae]